MLRIRRCIFALSVVLSASTAFADPPAPQYDVQEVEVGVTPKPTSIGAISFDGRHYASMAEKDGKKRIFFDGKKAPKSMTSFIPRASAPTESGSVMR